MTNRDYDEYDLLIGMDQANLRDMYRICGGDFSGKLLDLDYSFIGLTMDTTREDMTQAVLEGVAFAIRDSFEVAKSLGIQIERTKICGGGAKSPLWRRMIANVLNIKVDRIESEEGPALGGAMLAAVACGVFSSVEEAAEKIVRVTETIEPEPELVEKYERQYQKFAKIYPTVKDLFTELL